MLLEHGDRIVFAGDSVTDMGSFSPVGEGRGLGDGYVHLVDSFLTSFYPELHIRVTNSGMDGHNSRMLLERFDRDVTELNPDWVSICIGINDVWRQFDSLAFHEAHTSLETYEANLEAMIAKIKGKVKGIIMMTPYYIEANTEDAMRARMDEYGAVMKKVAEKHGAIFIDLQKVFAEFCGVRHSTNIAWDRVHPNQAGSMLIAKAFLKAIGFDFSK